SAQLHMCFFQQTLQSLLQLYPIARHLGTFGASPSATGAVQHQAQSSVSPPGPPAASPDVRRLSRGNPSCVPADRGSTAPAPDVAFPTSGPRLPASDALASTSAPVLPRRASSTAPSISSLLPWPLARASGQRSQLFGATTKQPLKLV